MALTQSIKLVNKSRNKPYCTNILWPAVMRSNGPGIKWLFEVVHSKMVPIIQNTIIEVVVVESTVLFGVNILKIGLK